MFSMCCIFVCVYHVCKNICRRINLLHRDRYETMMTLLIEVLNDMKKNLLTQESNTNGIFQSYYRPISINKSSDWDTFKSTVRKVGELLLSHQYLCTEFATNPNGVISRSIDPLSVILIHRNANSMIDNLLPKVGFILSLHVYNVINFFIFTESEWINVVVDVKKKISLWRKSVDEIHYQYNIKS